MDPSRSAHHDSPPDVAFAIPVFNEQAVIPDLIDRLTRVLAELEDLACEVVFIDDGSLDRTHEILVETNSRDPRFRWIRFSRNFGLQAALTAGLMEIEAASLVFLDADLQDPPELIPALVKRWQAGADVVLAVRRSRTEKGIRGLLMRAFHRLLPLLTGNYSSEGTGNFGLLSKRAMEALRNMPERNRYFPGLRKWVGFRVEVEPYERAERRSGESKQSIPRLVHYAMDAIFSFSYLPLRVLTAAGILISSGGFAIGLYFAVKRLIGLESAFTGFTTIVVLVVCLGGFQLIALGVIGEYLLRIYEEVKQRPPYILEASSSADKDRPGN